MATVEARQCTDGKHFRVRLSESEDTNRPRINLGKVTRKQAETVRGHVENLIAARTTGTAYQPATQAWIAEAPDDIRGRLETLGLVRARKQTITHTVAGWIADYLEKRTDIKPNTARNMRQAQAFMLEFMEPEDLPLSSFTQGHAEDFRRFLLAKGQAESTVRRRCKRVKQFFESEVKRRILEANPFDGIPVANIANNDRQRFIDRPMIQKVLDACPDARWRLIFALARYGGLRIPSELERMTWEDLGWIEGDRFTVRSPKTEHIEGKAQRSVPLFPELIPCFQDALAEANPDEALVFPILGKRSNLRTQAHRIIRRAGLEPWPRVFQNLRSSRETELVEEFPVHVVTDWIGNSPDVAKRHYLQTHEEHFKRAAGDGRGTGGGLNSAAERCAELQTKSPSASELTDYEEDSDSALVGAGTCKTQLAPPRGLEPLLPG